MARFIKGIGNERFIMQKMLEMELEPTSGICRGIAVLAIHYMLRDKHEEFNELTREIFNVDSSLDATDYDDKLKAFIAAIHHYQVSQKKYLARLCKKHKTITENSAHNLILFTNKHSHDNHSNLTYIPVEKKQFKQNELTDLFSLFRQTGASSHKPPPIAFLITSRKHAIAASYDFANHRWQFINSKKLPIKCIVDDAKLIENVISSFRNYASIDNATFNIMTFTPSNQRAQARDIVAAWQNNFCNAQDVSPTKQVKMRMI